MPVSVQTKETWGLKIYKPDLKDGLVYATAGTLSSLKTKKKAAL